MLYRIHNTQGENLRNRRGGNLNAGYFLCKNNHNMMALLSCNNTVYAVLFILLINHYNLS